jgi:undecaprenyl diphosphate synthase
MSAEEQNAEAIPQHIAIIMDGNGRWAQQRGLPRIQGHEKGAESVREAVRSCQKLGVKYLTLYAFSVENWVRPKAEVSRLMFLLERFMDSEEAELHENEVRLRIIGRRSDLPKRLDRKLKAVEERTRGYDRGHLSLALSYGSRTEIANAARQIAVKAARGELDPEAVDEATVAAHLYAPDVPDPDLLIRTSGEMRVSNFLLWQISYSEIYITDVLWPDFREENLRLAIEDYGRRHRRFGGVT